MSYVVAAPELLATAASDMAGIGSSLSQAHSAAAASTTSLVAAAEDEVSTAIAALFSDHGQAFQALGAQTSSFHSQFVQALHSAQGAYAAAEAANASPLAAAEQGALSLINAPAEALAGRPLIGNGANGTAANPNGGGGGILYGNGGNGYSQAAGSGLNGGSGGSAGLFGHGGNGGNGGSASSAGGVGGNGGSGGSGGLLGGGGGGNGGNGGGGGAAI